jgi:hypothetical protein
MLDVIMLSFIMLDVIMLSFIMLDLIMLSVTMQSVMAPGALDHVGLILLFTCCWQNLGSGTVNQIQMTQLLVNQIWSV